MVVLGRFGVSIGASIGAKINLLLHIHSSVPNLIAYESFLGCSNYYGQIVFDCVPACGTIEPGTSQEIAVTFTADHPSDCYADELRIEVNNDVSETVRLRARASSTLMYLQGFDEVQPNEESQSEIIPQREEGECNGQFPLHS